MTLDHERLVAITGGPGVGKTTLIDELRARGYGGTFEAARGVIRSEVAAGEPQSRLVDPYLFGARIYSWELESYRTALDSVRSRDLPLVFFDRGFPELAAFFRRLGAGVPVHVEAAARECRYHSTVFIAPVWPDIYVNDAERIQTVTEAREVELAVTAAYRHYGYDLVELPLIDPAGRADFVLSTCPSGPS